MVQPELGGSKGASAVLVDHLQHPDVSARFLDGDRDFVAPDLEPGIPWIETQPAARPVQMMNRDGFGTGPLRIRLQALRPDAERAVATGEKVECVPVGGPRGVAVIAGGSCGLLLLGF